MRSEHLGVDVEYGGWRDPAAVDGILDVIPARAWPHLDGRTFDSLFQDTIGQQLHSRRGRELAERHHTISDRYTQLTGFHQAAPLGVSPEVA
jgi:hypothetical protein